MGLNAVTLFRYVRRKTFQKNKICFLKCLAGVAGFEPTGAGIKIPCLTAWRHPSKSKWGGRQVSNLLPPEPQSGALPIELRPPYFGAPGETRTPDTRLRRPLLYPAELRAHKHNYCALIRHLERVMGIGPTQPAWKASVLPLNYTRITYKVRTTQCNENYNKSKFCCQLILKLITKNIKIAYG